MPSDEEKGTIVEVKFYKCEVCGNVAIKVVDSGVPMVCCGQEMVELVPDTVDAVVEKHIPDVTIDGAKVEVNIGSVDHPMIDVHWIEVICLVTEKGFQVVWLNPGDAPHATFAVADGDKPVKVYEYCNIHGLWVKEL